MTESREVTFDDGRRYRVFFEVGSRTMMVRCDRCNREMLEPMMTFTFDDVIIDVETGESYTGSAITREQITLTARREYLMAEGEVGASAILCESCRGSPVFDPAQADGDG